MSLTHVYPVGAMALGGTCHGADFPTIAAAGFRPGGPPALRPGGPSNGALAILQGAASMPLAGAVGAACCAAKPPFDTVVFIVSPMAPGAGAFIGICICFE